MPTVFEVLEIVMKAALRLTMFILLSVMFLSYLLFKIVGMLQDLEAEIHLLYRGKSKCIHNVSDVTINGNGGLYG